MVPLSNSRLDATEISNCSALQLSNPDRASDWPTGTNPNRVSEWPIGTGPVVRLSGV
jgi:hypothetical protein